jgi:peptidoglycan/LPS O-acetylase OafA/YrhL
MVRTSTFNPNIQTLRGLSVLLVVLYHFFDFPRNGGALGVGIFFCISGYVITNLLIVEFSNNNRIDIVRFYSRRLKRLLPLLLLVLLLTTFSFLVLASISIIVIPTDHMLTSVVACALYVGNFYGFLSQDSNDLFLPIGHFWSLAVEEQFYLIYPIVILILLKKSLKIQIVFFLFLILLSFLFQISAGLIEFTIWTLPFTYLETLGFGCLWAILQSNKIIRLSPKKFIVPSLILIMAIAILEFSSLMQSSFLGLGYSVFSAVEISIFCLWLQIPRLGMSRVLSYFGDISYSLYCIHFPILCLLATIQDGKISSDLNLKSGLIGLIFSILLSHLSRFRFEKIFWKPSL